MGGLEIPIAPCDDGIVNRIISTSFFQGQDSAVIEQVSIIGGGCNAALPGPQKAILKMRFSRTPIIGDKFASRAGQKGTLR